MFYCVSDLRAPKMKRLTELAVLAMLGTVMFVSKLLMSALPNIHIVAVLAVTYTLIFRVKALIPIYVYVFLELLDFGFTLWWIPNLYMWAIVWALAMLIPSKVSIPVAAVLSIIICGFHGFAYGTMWAPAQALLVGYDFKQMLTWIAFGIPYDLIHGISNLTLGTLVIPLTTAIRSALKYTR